MMDCRDKASCSRSSISPACLQGLAIQSTDDKKEIWRPYDVPDADTDSKKGHHPLETRGTKIEHEVQPRFERWSTGTCTSTTGSVNSGGSPQQHKATPTPPDPSPPFIRHLQMSPNSLQMLHNRERLANLSLGASPTAPFHYPMLPAVHQAQAHGFVSHPPHPAHAHMWLQPQLADIRMGYSADNTNQVHGKRPKRTYNCQRCENHQRHEKRKDHKNHCPFRDCACELCNMVDTRRLLNKKLQSMDEEAQLELEDPNDPQIGPREPKCQRCKHHGESHPLKNHKRVCKHKHCACEKCVLVTNRRLLMAKQIKLRRAQKKEREEKLNMRAGAAAFMEIQQYHHAMGVAHAHHQREFMAAQALGLSFCPPSTMFKSTSC